MHRKPALREKVRSATLSQFLPALLIVSTVLSGIALLYINEQVNRAQERSIEAFEREFNDTINALSEQVDQLASNDLIINSLIDYSNRESYLPVFFRSLRPAHLDSSSEAFSFVFTDFEGEIITGKNQAKFTSSQRFFDWKSTTLDRGLPFIDVNAAGLFISYPVFYSDSAEGAIALFIPDISTLLHFNAVDYNIIVFDDGKAIYAANKLFLGGEKVNSISPEVAEALSSKYRKFKNLDTYLIQSYGEAYAGAGWIIAVTIAALVVILLAMLFSVHTASTKASEIITRLKSKLPVSGQSIHPFGRIKESEDESLEIQELRETFNNLMDQLLAATFFRERIEGVIDSLDEMLVVVDLLGEELLSNKAFHELKSHNLSNPESDSLETLFPPETIVPEELNGSITTEYKGKNGNRTVSWHRTLYKNTEGDLIGIVLSGVDITKAIALQQELSLKNQAIDEAQTPIIIAEATTRGFPISYVNKAFEAQTGYTAEEVIGKNCRFLQGENTNPETKSEIASALNKLEPITTTILNYRKDGSEFYNRLSLSPIRDSKNQVTHVLGFQLDVTDQERTQQFLEHAKERAEESAKLKSEFLASMSHEIRTPMNGILGMLGLLEGTTLNKDQAQHVCLAKNSAESLLVIINDILDFSKIEAGKLVIENTPFDLINLLTEVVGSVACVAQEKRLELVLDVTDINARTIKCDPVRLRQIMNNLLSNAIKFTERGYVKVTAKTTNISNDKFALDIAVEDSGVGVPEHRIDSIFDSFSQVDASTTRKFGGTGLGLTICKQLAELMDGDINVFSEDGKGSTFSLHIEAEADANSLIDVKSLSGMSVGLLQQNTITAGALARQLESWRIDTEIFESEASVLNEVCQRSFDLIVIDDSFPMEDPKRLISDLRVSSKAPELKIWLLTEMGQLQDAKYLNSLGLDSYFTKPISQNDLFSMLSNLHAEDRSIQEDSLASSERDSQKLVGLHALLVEDNPINQVLAITLLEGKGLTVEVANHGQEALEKLKATPNFQMIFMDCQMPEMDGYQATRAIREGECGEKYRDIPIIAMTANAIKGDREKCLDAGMSDYLSKPIDTKLLHEKIIHWSKPIGFEAEQTAPEYVSNPDVTNAQKDERKDLQLDTTSEPVINPELWDRNSALKRTIGREDLLMKVLNAYMEDTPSLVLKLVNALNNGDLEQTAYLAHTLKGASLNISAPRLSDLALELEMGAKNDSLAETEQLISKLNKESESLFTALTSYAEDRAS